MFGYIASNPKMLSEAQRQRYKSCYCGLCRELNKTYGKIGRLTLSNDMTFLAILLASLYEPEETAGSESCPIHPLRKARWIRTGMTAYAADMNYLLAYWKCEDNLRDEGDLLQGQMARRMAKHMDGLNRMYPIQTAAVRESLDEIHRMEDARSQDVDALCRLSGKMVGAVFAPKEDAFSPILRQIGSSLGEFVYLMDAWEDFEEDRKKNRFNPLAALHEQPDYEDLIRNSLLMFMGEAVEACELLPLERDLDLIRHVLYHGVWTRYASVLEKRRIKLPEGEVNKDEGSVSDAGTADDCQHG